MEEVIFRYLEREGLITKDEMYRAIEYLYRYNSNSDKNREQKNLA